MLLEILNFIKTHGKFFIFLPTWSYLKINVILKSEYEWTIVSVKSCCFF